MKKLITSVAVAAGLTIVPASAALATTVPDDPDDVAAVDNPLDENDDDEGFDDWGLLGLLGLAGLAGLRRPKTHVTVREDRPVSGRA